MRLVIDDGGRKWVVVNDIAEGLGVGRSGAQERATAQFPKGIRNIRVPSPGGVQGTLCLSLDVLPAFLVGCVPAQCREEIRPEVQRIKDELVKALRDYTFDGVAVNPAFPP